MKLRVQLYTVPGQVHYNATRQVVLRGVDAIVFVADSQREMMRSNRDSWENLKDNLLLQGVVISEVPHVLQYNKRDLPGILSIEELDEALNEFNAPFYEAVSTTGIGVEETLQGVVKLVARSLRDRFRLPSEGPITEPVVFHSPAVTFAPPVDLGAAAPASAFEEPEAPPEQPADAQVFPFAAPEPSAPPAPVETPTPAMADAQLSIGEITHKVRVTTLPPLELAADALSEQPPASLFEAPDELAFEPPTGLAFEPAEAPAGSGELSVPADIETAPLPPPSEIPFFTQEPLEDPFGEPMPAAAGASGDVFAFEDEQPAPVDEAQPAAAEETITIEAVAETVEPAVEPVVQLSLHEADALATRAAIQRAIPRALAQVGEVRELELEVPVPAQWTGGKRLTLQLRLTLVPQEDENAG
jgi:hypothetical protein